MGSQTGGQVKSEYVHHKAISGAIGVKLCATGIEKAVAGTPIMVVGPEDDEEDIKEEVRCGDSTCNHPKCAMTYRSVCKFAMTLSLHLPAIKRLPLSARGGSMW